MKIIRFVKKLRFPYFLAILPNTDPASWQLRLAECNSSSNDAVCRTLLNAKTLLFEVGGAIAVLLIIYAGFTYVTAYGNEERATTAKKIILWTIVGVIVMIMAEVLISEVVKLLK